MKICGVDAASAQAVIDACAQGRRPSGALITLADLKLDNDAIVIATPEIAGLPYVISGPGRGRRPCGGAFDRRRAAARHRQRAQPRRLLPMLDPNAPTARRLIVARVLLVCVAVAGAYTASFRPADIVAMVAWAFSLAAGGLFPALVLGIWWKRTTSAGAICGIIAGFGITLLYLVVTRYYPAFGVELPWHELAAEPGHRRAGRRRRGGTRRSCRRPTRPSLRRSAGSTSTTSPRRSSACRSALRS